MAERGDERGGSVVASAISRRPVNALPLLERLEDERLLLRAHALEPADPALAGGALEVVERADFQAAVEQRDGLRADALQPEQVENRRRKFLEQLLVIATVPVSTSSRIFAAEILADPGDAETIGRRERGDGVAEVQNRIRGVSVRADLERVLVLDFEQVADLGEHSGEGRFSTIEVAEAFRLPGSGGLLELR